MAWTIEPHGKGYALYSGRGPMAHGMNLVYMSEPDANWEATKKLIESAPEMADELERYKQAIERIKRDLELVKELARSPGQLRDFHSGMAVAYSMALKLLETNPEETAR